MLTTERVGIANVTFEPGCRNNWHIPHKGGQIYICEQYFSGEDDNTSEYISEALWCRQNY